MFEFRLFTIKHSKKWLMSKGIEKLTKNIIGTILQSLDLFS